MAINLSGVRYFHLLKAPFPGSKSTLRCTTTGRIVPTRTAIRASAWVWAVWECSRSTSVAIEPILHAANASHSPLMGISQTAIPSLRARRASTPPGEHTSLTSVPRLLRPLASSNTCLCPPRQSGPSSIRSTFMAYASSTNEFKHYSIKAIRLLNHDHMAAFGENRHHTGRYKVVKQCNVYKRHYTILFAPDD